MKSLQQEWNELGPAAAQVIGLRLWWVPLWSVMAPRRAFDESHRMVAEKHAALMETQMRLACVPWLLAMRTLLVPLEAGAHAGPMLSAALIAPSRRRLRANAARLRALR